jgi:hypothetical protein
VDAVNKTGGAESWSDLRPVSIQYSLRATEPMSRRDRCDYAMTLTQCGLQPSS